MLGENATLEETIFFVFISSKANNEVYLLLGKVGGPQTVRPRWQKQRDVVKTHLFTRAILQYFRIARLQGREGLLCQ